MFQVCEKEQNTLMKISLGYLYIELWKNYFYGLFFLIKKTLHNQNKSKILKNNILLD